MPILDVKDGRYFAVIAFVYGDAHRRDWFGSAWRDLPDGVWKITYRFRYYVDRKTHESDDDKHCYEMTGTAGLSEEKVILAVRSMTDTLLSIDFNDRVDFLEVRTSDPRVILETIAEQPWAHFKKRDPQ